MTSRLLPTLVAAGGLVLGAGCRSTSLDRQLPEAPAEASFFGPGRERLDFSRLPVIRFETGSWTVGSSAGVAVAEVRAAVGGGSQLVLVGVGDGDVPVEHSRQQGLARAVAVRRMLIDQGADGAMVSVTGFADGEAVGLTGRDDKGPRVECAVVVR
jgi:hypothetical protein